MSLTLAHVKTLPPNPDKAWASALVATWPAIRAAAQLTTATRARHFLAQTAEESGGSGCSRRT